MLVRLKRAAALAALIAAPLAGAAHAHEGARDGLLPALPADAPPGECYAHVRLAGPPAPPPMVAGARWVLNAGPPGAPGPIWCLEPTLAYAPAPPPVEREGWIRVLCDRDATPDRISRLQRRLHQRGLYRGGFTGRYDAETAAAVTRYQDGAHIAHGGYLSLQTLDAIESEYAYGAAAAGPGPPAWTVPPGPPDFGPGSSYVYGRGGGVSGYGYGYGYAVQPPPFPQPPCCRQPGASVYGEYGYPQGGPTPPYASRSAIQNGWLTWPGKTLF